MNRKLAIPTMLSFMIGGSIFLFLNEAAFTSSFLFIMGIMASLWVFSLIIKDSSIVDIFWGSGFVLVAWYYAYLTSDGAFDNIRSLILTILVTIWGLRLTIHLGIRNIGKPEDFRYQQFRKEGGKNYWWISFFRVFFLQGIILWVISSIYYVSDASDLTELTTLDYIGIGLWLVGFLFETVGDWQLTNFKKNPVNKGKVLDTGLWRYTRHPNYFGDALLWWGFFMFTLGSSVGWLFAFSPIFMSFLLRYVSGVPMLEASMSKNKAKYGDYMRKTSVFIPMPPKG